VFKLPGATLVLLALHLAAAAPPPLVCPAGAPIGNVDLQVRSARGGASLPLKTLNRLGEGDTILYKPIVRASETRKGEVAIVLVPVVRPADADPLVVLDPKPAGAPASWQVPSRSAVAVFVYGPAGLNRGKVKSFLSKDDDLVSQLADYAEKTAQTEALITALASDAGSGETMNSALSGFASQYGAAQIDRTQPANQQLMLAMRTLNPAVASYDPISPQSSQRIGQTASLATSVAALFFGSPVGLAAGGTAMLMEMHSIVFPNTVFRSSFAEPLPDNGLGLCGKRDAVPAHTKVAYLWATRIPNIGPPHLSISKAESLPAGMKAPVAIAVSSEIDWKYLDRARKWTLESELPGRKGILIPVHPDIDPKNESKRLDVDLTKANVPPGTYRLAADWDWDSFIVSGAIDVAGLSDFHDAKLQPESQDRLIAKAGRIPVTLGGSDFEFVTKVELARPGDKFFTPVPIPFVLPKGFRDGVQDRMDLQINTSDLDPADYRLLVTQADGKPHPVAVAILNAPPHLDGSPITIHEGDAVSEITLHGERLDRITSIESPVGKITLSPASADGSTRPARIQADPQARAGQSFDFKLYAQNRTQPLAVDRALTVIAPRAVIVGSRLSLPPESDVALNPGELPSDYVLSAMLQVKGFDPGDSIGLKCRGDREPRVRIRAGERNTSDSLSLLSGDSVFVTFDDGVLPNGCELLALVGSASDGGYPLGRIVHIPKIKSLDAPPFPAANGAFEATLTGQDLEMIDRAGWDPDHGAEITELPSTIPGEGKKQILRIKMAAGPLSPDVPLYVWLRGETTGRATLVHAPAVKLKAGVTTKSDARSAR
jgi:hypothetical protein